MNFLLTFKHFKIKSIINFINQTYKAYKSNLSQKSWFN